MAPAHPLDASEPAVAGADAAGRGGALVDARVERVLGRLERVQIVVRVVDAALDRERLPGRGVSLSGIGRAGETGGRRGGRCFRCGG